MLALARVSYGLRHGARVSIRNISIKQKAKDFNKVLNRIGDEDSEVSRNTMKYLRKIGGVSVIVVLCLILWASSMENVVEQPVPLDLLKDIRDLSK